MRKGKTSKQGYELLINRLSDLDRLQSYWKSHFDYKTILEDQKDTETICKQSIMKFL